MLILVRWYSIPVDVARSWIPSLILTKIVSTAVLLITISGGLFLGRNLAKVREGWIRRLSIIVIAPIAALLIDTASIFLVTDFVLHPPFIGIAILVSFVSSLIIEFL